MFPPQTVHLRPTARARMTTRWIYSIPILLCLWLLSTGSTTVYSTSKIDILSAPHQSPLQQPTEQPVQLNTNSHVLLGSPSIFSIIAEPEFVFFQLDVGDGSDLIFSEDPTLPFTYVYEAAGTYEYQLMAFGASEEPFVITGFHTITEFITSPWLEPKLNYDFGEEVACDECPIDQYAILDPVYLHNGEFFLEEEDLRIPGRGFDYVFQRTYKSQMLFDGRLGYNWMHNYAQHLVSNGTNILHVSGAGRRDLYASKDGINFTAPAGFYTQLTRNKDNTYTIREAHGSQALFNALDGSPAQGRLTAFSDRNGNTMRFEYDGGGRLVRVNDTLGRPVDYVYNVDGRLDHIEDFIGRRVSFTYDANGDLVAVTGPAVTGTPTGNNFPDGKTWRYTYSSGFGDERLNHNLLSIIAPNEVADGSLTPFVFNAYAETTSPTDYAFDRVVKQQWGGTNASGVPAGGTLIVSYEELNPDGDPDNLSLPRNRTTVIDRNGNQEIYEHNINGHRLSLKEFSNRDLRASDPDFWERVYEYNADGQLLSRVQPEGNRIDSIYDEANTDRLRQGNRIAQIRRADPDRGGDQAAITTTWTYEPIYNQVRTMTEPRGNDATYVPQNGGTQTAQRYTTTYVFDYEESCDFAAIGAQIGHSAEDVEERLHGSDICLNPRGDLNDDGVTTQVAGNVIVANHPSITLLPEANMVAVEGATQQPIVERVTYNQFGQRLTLQDPEGNVDRFVYYSEQDPNGDGTIDNAGGDPDTGGYLKQLTRDAAIVSVRNSAANQTPVEIRNRFVYDAVGNVTREIDGRGIATDYFVNERNQVVQTVRAAALNLIQPSPAEPTLLSNFQYRERVFYDANDNVVLRQVEDRGNTSLVDGNPPATDLPPAATNPDPIGGTAYVDTVYRYDILNNQIEMLQEVGSQSGTPTFLRTRTRYDGNEQAVLIIEPEGNATTSIYDERDLLFQQTRGATTPPPQALLAPTDPTNYDVRGGIPATATYHYDQNRNLVEAVDAADTDGSAANNSDLGGTGDRTRTLYDGFDRPNSIIDSVGNQTIIQYDPAGNKVRTLSFGPVDGASPQTDGLICWHNLSRPTVIQLNNLVNGSLLAATEWQYDELKRGIRLSRSKFQVLREILAKQLT
ncbi:hypothetical protein KFU94_32240 [Chloroflexi bacterium TSY]|nr:hypothetical protein [Chloroflexi bacterium TSY]